MANPQPDTAKQLDTKETAKRRSKRENIMERFKDKPNYISLMLNNKRKS